MSFLSLLSTVNYGPNGIIIPNGYIQTISSNGAAEWTSTLGLATGLSVSTLRGSTLLTSEASVQSVGYSTLTGSTLYGNSGTISTLRGSTLTTGSVAVSTLLGSTVTTHLISAPKVSLTSTVVALGQSTTQTQTNFSNGSYTANSWTLAKSSLVNGRKVAMSSSGQYQIIVSGGTNDLWLSADSGVTWTGLTTASCGLPTLTGSAYWSSGSISASGQQIILAIYGGSLWMSNDYGRTFSLTKQATPDIWLQLNGDVTDTMGGPAATVTGSPSYVTIQHPGYADQAINLANTAGGTATQYVRGAWTGATNFTVSFWMNPLTVNSIQQEILSMYATGIQIIIGTDNKLYHQYPTGSGSGVTTVVTPYTLTANTWYYVSFIFQTGGACSFYVNNILVASYTNVGLGTFTNTFGYFSLGTYEGNSIIYAFNGYIADFRLYNSAVPYVPIPLLAPNVWLPFENNTNNLGSDINADPTIWLPFEGTTADSKGVSTITPTGSFTYVGSANPDITGSQSINIANTAGGSASNYIRGSYTFGSNFSVSGWFNLQTLPTSGDTVIFSIGNGVVTNLILAYSFTNSYLYLYTYDSGNTQRLYGNVSVQTNTWYHFLINYQTSGTCNFFINGLRIGSGTGYSLLQSTTQFSLGTLTHANVSAFNGYIDDLRIWNSIVNYSPAGFATGSVSYVPGVVGLNAVSLVNTAGGTASNYLRGICPPIGSDVTVSGWVNLQSFSASGYQVIFSMYFAGIHLYSNDLYRTLVARFPSGSGGGVLDIVSSAVSLNTWYHYVLQFKINGTCSFYLNGSLVGSVTNSGGYGTFTSSGSYAVGTYENSTGNALNAYVDDLRIYNAAIPFHILFPQNYRSVALSGSGQYLLASAASGHVVGSSDSGMTWTKQSVSVGTQGDLIQPNKTGLTQAQWEKDGVNYVATVSSEYTGGLSPPYRLFNNVFSIDSWVSSGTTGLYNASGVYVGNNSGTLVSTTIQGGIGVIYGEWAQIQVNVPVILQSYTYASGNNPSVLLPKSYYLVGSMDGSTWFPLQFCSMTVKPITTTATLLTSNIVINNTDVINVGVGSGTTIAYSTSTAPYLYFRIVIPTIWTPAINSVEIGELYLNFARPSSTALALSHSGQYQMVASGSAAGNVMPNQSGLSSNTWTQGGVNWAATASSQLNNAYASQYAFNNYYGSVGNYSWASPAIYNTTTGVYNGSISTTILGGIGAQIGEWLQIQSSVPLVLQSYTYGCGAYGQVPKTYYIIGSIDGSSWYPLQYVAMTTNPLTDNFTVCTSYITTNTTGSFTVSGGTTGSGTSTAYSYTTQPWMYFRIILLSLWSSGNNGNAEFGELYLNFSNSVSYSSNYGSTWSNTATTMSNEIVSLSPSGQYALSTNTVAPLARLTMDNTAADSQGALTPDTGAGSVSYSSSIVKVGTHSAYFNNTPGVAPSVYLNYTVPTILNNPSALTMACWVYPTALDAVLQSYVVGLGIPSNHGIHLRLAPSRELLVYVGNSAYTLVSGQSVPLNTWSHIALTYSGSVLSVYYNGIIASSATLTKNPAGSGDVAMTNCYVGCPFPGQQAFAGYVDDVRIYTQALSADEVASLYANPALTQAIGVSSSYLPITSYVKPVLPGATANVVDAKVSQTGQYMVAVTAANTNNVYYSTDSGSSFNALSVNGYTQAGATTPLARLPFDNASEDVLGGLTQATGAGTVTYSTSIKKVGTHSAFFNNTAGSTATNYLNYTVPAVLNTPPALTMACWIYPTSYASSNSAFFIGMPGGGGQSGNAGSSLSLSATTGIVNFYSGKTSGSAVGLSSNIAAPLNTWTHVALTFSGGLITIYVNGVSQNTTTIAGNLSNDVGGPMANLIIGCVNGNGSQAYAGYIDDVRLYTSALTATEIAALYAGTYDSLYTVAPMTACAISSDGSYFTVTNSSTTYTLNRNSKGFTLALGSQAGSINQALNSIAIGNKAGQINQSANSIVINATGATLSTGNDGCYVAPIASGSKSSSTALTLLGYGTDSQVVQSGIRVQNTQQIIYGEWIQQQLATPQPISAYAIMNRNGYAIQCPTAWYILGSIDGTNWDLLDYQRNITNTNGAIYSLPSLTPLYSYYRFVISQINRSSSSLTSNVTAFADIGGFVLYKNGSPLFSAPTATNALAPYTLSGPYSNILQSNGNTLSTITFSWLPIGQSFYGIGFDGALGTYNMGLIAVQNGHLNTTAPSGTFLGFYIPVTSFGSGANCEYDTNGIAFQGTSTSITSPSLSLSGTTNIEGTLTVSGGFSATVDLTAQGPYLIPSPENAPIILQWLQKTVATVTPTTGISPFWGTGLTFSPSIAHGQGDNAFAGGVLLQDGRVVFVPLMSPNVGIFNPHTNTFTAGPAHGQGSNAFYGGCLLPDGRVFFAPLNSLVIGLYNPLTNTFTAGPAHGQGGEGDKYVDPVLLPNGKVMLCPASTPNIGLYDPSTNTFSLGPAHGQGSVSSFAGSKLLPDGRVVMIPQNSSYMGIYDPIKNTFTRGAYAGGGSYVGGVLLHDGRVVCVPLTANIGVYNPYTDTFQVGAAHGQGATSYLGGSLLPDGRVAMAPYGAVNITIYNPVTNSVNIVSGNVGAGYAGCITLFDGRILFVPRTSSNIGLLHTNVVANRELCLSPYFNNF